MIEANAVSLRQFTQPDIIELCSLIESHALFEQVVIDVSGLSQRLSIEVQSNTPRLTIFVAEYDAELIGFTSLTADYSTWQGREFLHMDCLFVREKMRGKGVGIMLFETAEQYARQSDIGEIQWQSPVWNEKAQRFYELRGASFSTKHRYTLSL